MGDIISKQKIIILLTVLGDVIGFGMVIPILPFYLREFGASAFTVTLLFSTFSLCAFFSSPFLGALSDRIGRRPVLLISIFSTSLGWLIFANANSLFFLFLGRIIDGLAAGNFTTAQNYLVDIAKDDKERTTNLGIIGAVFGIGFMLGPLLGGILSKISHSFPFLFAGIMAFLNGIFAFFMLPETNFNRNKEKLKYNPFLPLIKAYKNKIIRPIFLLWLIFSIAFVISQSVFGLFSQNVFNFGAFQTGLFFTAIGVIIALNQALLLKRFWLHRFSELTLVKMMMIILSVGLALMGMQNIYLFFLALPLLGTGQAILRVVLTSQIAGKAEPNVKGEVLGISSSLMSAAMIVGPLIGGTLFEINFSIPFFTASLLLLTGFLLLKTKFESSLK